MQGVFQNEKELGQQGERVAEDYLVRQGYRILERNYRCRHGEIDLIVEKKEKILFVEVKTRQSMESVSPLELISRTKQRHISKTAQYYIAVKKIRDKTADFALVSVLWTKGEPVCEFLEGIFDLAYGY